MSGFRQTADRSAVVDPTLPYDAHDAMLVFRTPTHAIGDSDNFFLRPFQAKVYAVVGGCAVLVVLLLLLSRYCYWYTHARQRGRLPEVTQVLMSDVEMVAAGLLNRRKLH